MTSVSNIARIEALRTGLFETPFARVVLDDAHALIAALRETIDRRRSDDSGLSRSNQGGWHSDTRMLEWGGESARRLAGTARGLARSMTAFEGATIEDFEWRTTMWANVAKPGDFNALHVHPANVWAAVFYLDMGGDDGGTIYLEDPRFPLTLMRSPAIRLAGPDGRPQPTQIDIPTEAGELIVFPAWLRHGVRAHRGSAERVSIAMNLDLVEKR